MLSPTAEIKARDRLPGAEALENHRDWVVPLDFEIAALESELVVGAGSILAANGLTGAQLSRDGTLSLLEEPLQNGDEYSITSYYPQPTSTDLRQAPRTYPKRRFQGATLIGLPARDRRGARGGPGRVGRRSRPGGGGRVGVRARRADRDAALGSEARPPARGSAGGLALW